MAKIPRIFQRIFGSNAGASQIAQFGSLAAGTPNFTTDPTVIQSLGNYLTGWFGAVLGSNSPTIEDMNALCYLYAYQLAYLFQSGIPEYNADTAYFNGSVTLGTLSDGTFPANAGFGIYQCIQDAPVGTPVSNISYWADITPTQVSLKLAIQNWVTRSSTADVAWQSVAYSEVSGQGTLAAVSTDGTDQIMTSQNGIDWFADSAPVLNSSAGQAAINAGTGGSGGGVAAASGAIFNAGGGAGAGLQFIISNPSSSGYSYAVGAKGTGGTAGTGLNTIFYPGQYRICAGYEGNASTVNSFIRKNGATNLVFLVTSVSGASVSGCYSHHFSATETVGVYTDGTITLGATATEGYQNYYSIERTGN